MPAVLALGQMIIKAFFNRKKIRTNSNSASRMAVEVNFYGKRMIFGDMGTSQVS